MENKDLYHYESLNEMAFHYPELSKKDIQNIGNQQAMDLIAAAEQDEFKVLAVGERLSVFTDAFCSKLREEIVNKGFDDKFSAHGIEFSTRSTGDTYDWELDEEYSRIKKQLKEREELLKLAIKSENPIYDHQGVEVPRLPKKRAGYKTLTLKF
jgi:protoheme ferro-lyase